MQGVSIYYGMGLAPPKQQPEKTVPVYRVNDPHKTICYVPEFELVRPNACGMPDYIRAH